MGGQVAAKMKTAVLTDDWATIAMLMPQIAQRFNKIEVSDNHRLGKPWTSAYQLLAFHSYKTESYKKTPRSSRPRSFSFNALQIFQM